MPTATLSTGVALPYVVHGDPSGIPVLLIHAWGESRGSFDRLLSLLPGHVFAVAMDLRGHGEADKPHDGYALTEIAADVAAFLDEIGWTSAVVLGSSSGGYVAQQLAVARPDRVRGLVLVASPRSLYGRAPFADELDRLTDPVDREWVRQSLEWFPRFHEVPARYIEARIDDGVRMPAEVWRRSLAGLSGVLPPTETGTIIAPTLVIWGDRDELLPRAEGEALCAAIPGSRLVGYENTGHLVLWEQPERVAADLLDFLQAIG